jgi:hypothetical protein
VFPGGYKILLLDLDHCAAAGVQGRRAEVLSRQPASGVRSPSCPEQTIMTMRALATFALVGAAAAVPTASDPASHLTDNDPEYFDPSGPGHWGTPGGPSFDCAMRKLAYTFGKQLRPDQGAFTSLHAALDLNGFGGNCTTEAVAPTAAEIAAHRTFGVERVAPSELTVPEGALFVAPDGDDTAEGTLASPLASVQLACDRAAVAATKTVVLRGGVHYLAETLLLGPQHSDLTLMSYPGEKAVVSGGKELKVAWKKASNPARDDLSGAATNIWVADISGQVTKVPGLQIDGKRATRARYPNLPGGLETSCGYGCMVSSRSAKWTPPDFNKFGQVTYYTDNQTETARHDTPSNWFQHYSVGVNGLCSVYSPPVSYWCSEHTAGGGAFAFRTPTGVTPQKGALPNSPYKSVKQAQLFVWRPARCQYWPAPCVACGPVQEQSSVVPAYFSPRISPGAGFDAGANWMFEVGDYDKATGNMSFGHGGFQGARGSNNGGDWFIENVMEELDNPGEFFFDESASKLYLYHNGTGAPPASATVVAPQKQILVNHSGTQWNPVKNVKHTGITFTAAAYTYMEPHGVPSVRRHCPSSTSSRVKWSLTGIR